MPGSGTFVPLLDEVEPVDVDELLDEEEELLLELEEEDDELVLEDEPEVDEELEVLVHFFLQPPYQVAEAGAASESALRAATETSTLRIINMSPFMIKWLTPVNATGVPNHDFRGSQ